MKMLFGVLLVLVSTASVVFAEDVSFNHPTKGFNMIELKPGDLKEVSIGHWSYDAIRYLDSKEEFLEEFFNGCEKNDFCKNSFSESPQMEINFGCFAIHLIPEMLEKGYMSSQKDIDDTSLLIIKILYEEYKNVRNDVLSMNDLTYDLNDFEIFQNLEW